MKKHIYFTGIWMAVVLLAMIVACNPPKEEDTEPIAKPLSELARVNGIGFQQAPQSTSSLMVGAGLNRYVIPTLDSAVARDLCLLRPSFGRPLPRVLDLAYAPTPNSPSIFATTIHKPSLRRTKLSKVWA